MGRTRGGKFLFADAEKLQKQVDEYFTTLGERPPTLSGLAQFLNMSRWTLNNYLDDFESGTGRRSKGEQADCGRVLVKAKGRIETYLEEKLIKDYSRGVEFTLSNGYKGWGNKTAIEAKVDAKSEVKAEVEERKLSDEELMDRINLLAAKAEEIRKREGC